MRVEYSVSIVINNRQIKRVVVDPHYKDKHPEISDALIVRLVKSLSGQVFRVEVRKGDFEYFTVEPVMDAGKPYRLVLLIALGQDFLGVINAFRVRKKS